MEHNTAQTEAIRHTDGPCLVLAGPGSGKTRVITYRTKYLIEEANVDPANILVITFTKAAAEEMRDRFFVLMNQKSIGCTFGTFHSVFFMILRTAYGYRSSQVLSEEEKREIIKRIIRNFGFSQPDEEEFIRNVISEITYVKSEYIRIDNYYSMNCGEEQFRDIYRAYNEELYRQSKLDFDDMLIYTYELLKEREDIRRKWQDKFRYILIDEFQDINRIQYEIVKLLVGEKQNLFMVGDDDQSIYRFRGARPELMLSVVDDYPNLKKILLDINYRSGKEIVDLAGGLIKKNTKRYEKRIQSQSGSGAMIALHRFKDEQAEAEDIYERIVKAGRAGIPFSEQAVIFRTNREPQRILRMLSEYNIPFVLKDTIPNCYEHWIGKQVIAYAKIASGCEARDEYLKIWNRPVRYLKREYLDQPTVSLERILDIHAKKSFEREAVLQLEEDLSYMSTMPPFAMINFLRKQVGYNVYLRNYASERKLLVDELFGVLDEISELAKPYADYPSWFAHIENYADELREYRKKQESSEKIDAVTLTTMHSSKGLEYHTVYVLNANEGITPYKKAVKDEEIEEERRMFYVALTRAKQDLHIYTIEEQYGKPIQPSRFLADMELK